MHQMIVVALLLPHVCFHFVVLCCFVVVGVLVYTVCIRRQPLVRADADENENENEGADERCPHSPGSDERTSLGEDDRCREKDRPRHRREY